MKSFNFIRYHQTTLSKKKYLALLISLFLVVSGVSAFAQKSSNVTTAISDMHVPSISSANNTLKINNNTLKMTSNTKPVLIRDMTEEQLSSLIDENIKKIESTEWQTTFLSVSASTSYSLLGVLIGFAGAIAIDNSKEIRSIKAIRKLLRDDLLRIHGKIHHNLNRCNHLIVSASFQHEFLNRICTISDLEIIVDLGETQQFNFWQTVVSSTQLILLKKEDIQNAQKTYDELEKYNSRIESVLGRRNPSTAPYSLSALRYVIHDDIISRKNRNKAHFDLVKSCQSLVSIHGDYLKIVDEAITSLDKKFRLRDFGIGIKIR